MSSDYLAIREENQKRYGSDVVRYGPMLLADRYDDHTHFIFELLQNAEDALARRSGWCGSRAVRFHLTADKLYLSHHGKPFDERDVRGICGIAESTKDRSAIGRFGIGFKSVYAYTGRPEVHSGNEDFAIEDFVRPIMVSRFEREADETIIVLPLDAASNTALGEIAQGLRRLGPGTLLFLREIDEIEWRVDGGPSGVYLRSKPESLASGIRRVTVVGQEAEKPDVEETWLIFSREVKSNDATVVGQVEIAFSVAGAQDHDQWSIQRVPDSPLVVFFPTVVSTNLGFLVQGPYRTTPSRDNILRNNPWNLQLVRETASLLIESMTWLRDHGHLNVAALRCLPIDASKFPDGSLFAWLFETVRSTLKSDRFLPTSNGEHVSAAAAKLAATEELRRLFDPIQLGALFGLATELSWLSGDISPDRTPDIRTYLMRELEIMELRAEMVLTRLTKSFLEAQPDEWVLKFYEFLRGQPAIIRGGRLEALPIVRLTDGSHVTPFANGQPQAFLPSATESDFPTVRAAACSTKEAKGFLQSLGLTEPDPVDDVVRSVLRKYRTGKITASDSTYDADIRRIVKAFGTDSKGQREKLVAALRESKFVRVIDTGSGKKYFALPGIVYLATQRLKDLFKDVSKVYIVDDSYPCLSGEDVRDLLVACGAARSLQPVRIASRFTSDELAEMRTRSGASRNTGSNEIEDLTLRGLDELLLALPGLDFKEASQKVSILWDAICDVEGRKASPFSGTYKWFFHTVQQCPFDAAFVWKLNNTAWVPGSNGKLREPSFVEFETLGWKANPLLLSIIRFKPAIIASLAKEAGIDPAILDLLKELGVTSEAAFRAHGHQR